MLSIFVSLCSRSWSMILLVVVSFIIYRYIVIMLLYYFGTWITHVVDGRAICYDCRLFMALLFVAVVRATCSNKVSAMIYVRKYSIAMKSPVWGTPTWTRWDGGPITFFTKSAYLGLDAAVLGPVLLTLLRHVARILANGRAAFFESCDAIGWNSCDVSQKC